MGQDATPGEIEFAVPAEAEGDMVRVCLGDTLPLEPYEFLLHLIENGKVSVDGEVATEEQFVRGGETVHVRDFAAERAAWRTNAIPAKVIYEDAHLLVLNKPAGCTVIAESRTRGAACPFLNGVLAHLGRNPEAAATLARERYRPRPLHRIDRDTTGCVLIARSRAGELHLRAQMVAHAVAKEYLAVVHGEVETAAGRIEAAIAPERRDIARMRIAERGKPSVTEYAVVERFRAFTLLRAQLHTGRRHQLRLHFAHVGHPIAGDVLYGGAPPLLSQMKRGYRVKPGEPERPLIARQALHAAAVEFVPVGGSAILRVEAPLPRDFETLLKVLRKYAGR